MNVRGMRDQQMTEPCLRKSRWGGGSGSKTN
jgi:hypothetical protein